MGLGIGLSLNNAAAVISGLRERGGEFHRTPKYSIVRRGEDWRGKRYRAGRSATVVFEGLFAAYFAVCFVYAFRVGMWASLPFLYLFLQGYGYIFLLAVLPRLRRRPPSTSRRRYPHPLGRVGEPGRAGRLKGGLHWSRRSQAGGVPALAVGTARSPTPSTDGFELETRTGRGG